MLDAISKVTLAIFIVSKITFANFGRYFHRLSYFAFISIIIAIIISYFTIIAKKLQNIRKSENISHIALSIVRQQLHTTLYFHLSKTMNPFFILSAPDYYHN